MPISQDSTYRFTGYKGVVILLEIIVSILLGYLLGSISPAAAIGAVKKINLREQGTKNLGATNVTVTLGFAHGILVMVIDMLKAFLSVKIGKLLFLHVAAAGLLAGCSCVVGHIFPVFLRFRGGKGLAAFGGMILALDYVLFLILLSVGIVMVLITDYAISMTFSAVSLAPYVTLLRLHSGMAFAFVLAASGLVLYKHRENIIRVKNGTEMKMSTYLRQRSKKNK